MQQFPDAHHLMITGGSFCQTQNVYRGRDTGLHILEKYIAADAIFDSAERFPPAQCHPGTRKRIIDTIMEWIDDPSPEKQTLWLHGPAGAGKSAIGHTIATMLKDQPISRKYGSSFFFAKGAPGRGDGNKLFATIAYELAMNFTEYREALDAVMQESLSKRVHRWPSHHPTIIIDGLDECAGGKCIQSAILSTISNAIIQHSIPLRFLIISRPEYWIFDAFEIGCLSSVVKCLSLNDDLDAYDGVKSYLRDEFNRIYDENIKLMSSTPRPWPEEHIIDRFVRSASGQFIYASTVLNFVGDSPHCNPLDQLHILDMAGPHEASAFTQLDSLYAAILSSYPRWDSLKRVLTTILLKCTMSDAVMQHVFDIPPAELHQILRSMQSIIYRKEYICPPIFQKLEPIFGSPVHEGSGYHFITSPLGNS
ncbi:hypothetical protein JR316_0002864 [Psilocybe cubensis]|uniref:NACHT domain-containing protein n=2 Tax=Psilocybe cubensis TaxID=181762 RepID=A0A8H8CLE0_PSICU|nr:hypothetical protein JR316_0002864 [Psilocybe cubensis]KAH9483398.1 hypothetical protein JR316_0002864 [Psilocybe cubensis]